ncbi:MAG TPA: hypothetical protein VFA75_05300 [Nevskia sp.]|nr:hypothetical protein [Nevskia sp.]
MDRYDDASCIATPPTIPAPGTPGYPTDGVPGTQAPTTFRAWLLHALIEEIRNVIVAAGITPNKAVLTQLRDAIGVLGNSNALLKANNLSDLASLPAALANLGFTGSLTVPGYAVIPLSIGGIKKNLIMQWGYVVTSASEGHYTFPFPIAFPNQCLVLVPLVLNNTSSTSDDVWAQWDQAGTTLSAGAIMVQWDGQPSDQSDGYGYLTVGF